jgi:murein DD-endopeptidase MepM/ murein hydrolase activator NlpD
MKRLDLHKIKGIFKKAFTPITIMIVPHRETKPLNFKVPSIGIAISVILWIVGTVYVLSAAVKAVEYREMKRKFRYYSEQIVDLGSSISAIKSTEREMKRLVSLGSKEKILQHIDEQNAESVDLQNLKKEIEETIESVAEIKEFLRHQKDLHFATPQAMPVAGTISSPFGTRDDPRRDGERFHYGVDIRASSGTPVRSTADGIVSFSGWSGANGNLVAIEHGFGFRTFYAHNRVNLAKVGQRVKRGDIIGYVGTTGNATGAHVHYEVWKDGKPVNPAKYLKGWS